MTLFIIALILIAVLFLYVGYRTGYEDAKNKYEHVHIVFAPEELRQLLTQADEIEKAQETAWMEEKYREE
jgi:uncharacterized membrane protein